MAQWGKRAQKLNVCVCVSVRILYCLLKAAFKNLRGKNELVKKCQYICIFWGNVMNLGGYVITYTKIKARWEVNKNVS